MREVGGEESLGLLHSSILCSLSSFLLFHADTYGGEKKNGENDGTEQNKFSVLLQFLPAPVTGEHGTGEVRRKGCGEEAFFPTSSFLLLHFCFT